MEALEKPHYNFNLMMNLLIINFVIDLFLIPRYGLIGAALGSIIALLIGAIISLVILKSLIDVQLKRVFKYFFSFYIEALEFIIFFNEYKETFEEKLKSEKEEQSF